jgi:hypothetical protein
LVDVDVDVGIEEIGVTICSEDGKLEEVEEDVVGLGLGIDMWVGIGSGRLRGR